MADKKKQGIRSLLGDMIGNLSERGKGLGRLYLAPLGISLSRTAEAIKDILADMDVDEFKKKYGIKGTNEVIKQHFKENIERIKNPQNTREATRKRNEEALKKAASSKATPKQDTVTGAASNIPVPQQQVAQPTAFSGDANWKNPEYVKSMIASIGKQQGLSDNEIAFALAIAAKETGGSFNVNSFNGGTAKNPEESYGVFQINRQAHPDYTAGLDPIGNITYGVRFAANKLRQANGNAKLAARNYNGSGQGAEIYSQDFINNYYPKYSKDYLGGNIGLTDVIAQSTPEMVRAQNQTAYNQSLQGYANAAQQMSDETLMQGLRDLEAARQIGIRDVQNSDLDLSPEELARYNQPYMDEAGNIRTYAQDVANRLEQQVSPETFLDPMQQRLNEAYQNYYNTVNPLNPYTQMSQLAPVDLQNYGRIVDATNAQQNLARGLATTGVNYIPPADFAAQERAAAMARQEEALARQSGLTREDFLAGRGLDYTNAQKAEAQRIADINKFIELYKELLASNLTNQAAIANQAIQSGATLAGKGADVSKEALEGKQERMKALTDINKANMQGLPDLYAPQITAQGNLQKQQEVNLANLMKSYEESQAKRDVADINAQAKIQAAGINQGGQGGLKPSDQNMYFKNMFTMNLDPSMRNNMPNYIQYGVSQGYLTPEEGSNWLKGFGFGGNE